MFFVRLIHRIPFVYTYTMMNKLVWAIWQVCWPGCEDWPDLLVMKVGYILCHRLGVSSTGELTDFEEFEGYRSS